MTVTNILKDAESLTMTINATFDAPVERVWQVWNDPRQLERWWGPPTYPATVVDHDFSPGGTVTYYMTGPEGDRPHGWWRVVAVDAPHHLQFEDGFADGDGRPDPSLPTTNCTVHLLARWWRHRHAGRDDLRLAGGDGAAGDDGNGRGNAGRHGPDRCVATRLIGRLRTRWPIRCRRACVRSRARAAASR